MNVHTPPLFVPPGPDIPAENLGWFGFLKAIRTNALHIWPRAAYSQNIVAGTIFGRPRLLLNDPDAIHHVLVDNTANYGRTQASIRILRPIVGDGLLLSEGEEWRHQRRTMAPAMAPRVLPMLARHVAAAADEAITRLAPDLGLAPGVSRPPVDMLATVQFMALDIAARSMFSLEMRQYGAVLRRLTEGFAANLGRPHLFDLIMPVEIPTLRDFARMRFRRKWLALMDEIIAARMQAPESDKPRDLFDMLRAARDPETGAAFSHAQMRDQVATMIVAGHETTALTLFWSLYLLASAPAEQERLAREVRGIDLSPDGAGDALAQLPYTRAVVSEALRLYPPAFAIARRAIGPDRIGDLEISPGTLLMISPWVLHRHTRLWAEPEAFNPSRFLGPPPPRFAYLPFGAGPRVCVGAQFALTEACLVLAKLIQRFEFALADDVPVRPLAVIVTQPERRAPFRLSPRD